MKYIFQIFGLYLLLMGGIVGCANQINKEGQSGISATIFNTKWAGNKLWDDGLAEVAIYAAERTIYNKQRTFDYTLITVKEDFNQQYNVKTDDYKRKDLFSVMKVNAFCRIPTDNYPYHFLTSLFFKRQEPAELYKLTSSSQEWCGNTFKAINAKGDKYQFSFNSYWDNQGAGEFNLDNDILFEDQLPYTLRSLKFKDGLTFSFPVAELIQTNKASKPNITQGVFTVNQVKDTTGKLTWSVNLAFNPEKQNTYLFAADYPHILLRQTTWDGRTLALKEVKRYAYWQH